MTVSRPLAIPRTRRGLLLALCLLAFPMAAPPGTATAQNADAARQHFSRGVRQFESGNFAAALSNFRDAYRIRPHPSVLVNMANCYLQMDKPLEAAEHFERYLREARGDMDDDTRAEVERTLGSARASIATIGVEGPPGTGVWVDGDSVGRTPLRRPVEVNPGPHVVELRAPNGAVQTERVRLETAGSTTLRVGSPGPAPVGQGPPPGPQGPDGVAGPLPPGAGELGDPDPADDGEGLNIPLPTWIAGGVAVVTLGAGIAFGLTAVAQQGEHEDIVRDIRSRRMGDPDLPQLVADAEAVEDARSSNALLSDIMLITAVAAAGVAVYFLLTADDGDSAATTVSVAPTTDGGLLLLTGRL